jgi:putative SOS response-associated peptidase YedK
MRAADLAIAEHQSDVDLPPAGDVWIGNAGPVAHRAGEVVELVQMRFGMAPATPRGGPIFNLRSEGRHFANSNRCLVIASGFYEFTGAGYPKTKHRFTLNDAPCMAIAGIWRAGAGNQSDAFAMLTTASGPDVAPVHNRQIVVLRPETWRAWLGLGVPEAELLRPLPTGSVNVEIVRRGRGEEPVLI